MPLRAEVHPRTNNSYKLVIANHEDGRISDLQVRLDGKPITEHHDCDQAYSPGNHISALPAGNEVTYRLSRTHDSPTLPLDLHIDYVDSRGQEKEFNLPLTAF